MADIYTKKDSFDKAKSALCEFETKANVFDEDGNIESGREIYYYVKGLYFVHVHKPDSAELCFRKLQSLATNYVMTIAALDGLQTLYAENFNKDSLLKYDRLSDSLSNYGHLDVEMEKTLQVQAMYDYSRNERQAQKERERAEAASHRFRLFSVVMVFSLVMISLLAGLAVFVQRSKRRYAVEQYQLKSEQLKNANQSLALLREQGEASAQVISEKERDIVQLQAEIDKLLENRQLRADSEKAMLADSEIGHLISSKSASGQKITESEWEQIGLFVKENMSGFSHFLAENHSSLGMTKKRICILLRLYAGIKDTGVMLGVSAPYVSQQSGEILSDLFQISGSGKKLADKLRQIQ